MLIAEVNSAFANILADLLRDMTDELKTCTDGREAIKIYETFKPDIIFVDTVLAGYDGFEILEKIIDDDIIKIVMTFMNKPSYYVRAINLKADYVFVKPFNEKSFARRVREAAEMHWRKIAYPWEFPVEGDPRLRVRISSLLKELGVSPSNKGYSYMREGIMIACYAQSDIEMKSDIYDRLAAESNTEPHLVERAIRHAIEAGVPRACVEVYNECFSYTLDSEKGKPTNREFIMTIADKVLTEMGVEMGGKASKSMIESY